MIDWNWLADPDFNYEMQDTFNDDTGLEEVAEKGRAPMFISSNLGGEDTGNVFSIGESISNRCGNILTTHTTLEVTKWTLIGWTCCRTIFLLVERIAVGFVIGGESGNALCRLYLNFM